MKILYLTPVWYGFREMLFEGRQDFQGLPSFLYPLKRLIDQGHDVHYVILTSEPIAPKLNITADWINPDRIRAFCHYELTMPGKLLSILKYRRTIHNLLRNESFDFVYAHGTSTAVVRSVVRRHGIPFGQRLYGTFLWEKIKKSGLLLSAIKHMVEFLSFVRPKAFLLVTNDGSRGDLVKSRIFGQRETPYEFCYWVNGVSRMAPTEMSIGAPALGKRPYIFYCARFDAWKRQDRAVRIIRELKDRGSLIDLYFAGPFDTLGDEYFRSVKRLVSDLGVDDQVKFLGSISREQISLHHRHALASLSLYDVCNLTNVFHEMLAQGALILVKNDEVIRDYVCHGKNGFLIDDDLQAADIIQNVLSSPDSVRQLRENAITTSQALTKDWNERISDEVDLIKKYALPQNARGLK